MLEGQSICGLRIEFEPVRLTGKMSEYHGIDYSDCLRDDQAVFILGQEVELQCMPDAARPVDGCNIRHADSRSLLDYEARCAC